MTTVAGIVAMRDPDGSIGERIDGASVRFESQRRGGPSVSVPTIAGRYTVELVPGNWLASVSHRDAGSLTTWMNLRVTGSATRTVNFFLDSPVKRLETLVGSFPGEIGVYGELTGSAARRVDVNGTTPMYLASVAKVPIAVGCVDQMRGPAEMNDLVDLTLYHHRDERKEFDYTSLGRRWTVSDLMRAMIRVSDTTATDVLCAKYGIVEINRRLDALGLSEFSLLSSMIELDRRRYWLRNPRFGGAPPFALSLLRRHRETIWFDQLGIPVPRGALIWDEYRADGREQVTVRGMVRMLTAIADKSLFAESWKNDLMLDTIVAFGGPGLFANIAGATMSFDGKGGRVTAVRNEAGILRSNVGNSPLGAVAVFTERHEPQLSRRAAEALVAEAGELALRAMGLDPQLGDPPVSSARPILFRMPRPGQSFEQGDRPVIRWDSTGVVGRMTLALEDSSQSQTIISTQVVDDGEWHSYRFPSSLPSHDGYRFRLTGADSGGNPLNGVSPWFTVGGSLHVTRPIASDAFAPGDRLPIRWVSSGVAGRVQVRLLRNDSVMRTIATRTINDGNLHSWNVPENLERGAGYQVEVVSNSDPNITDLSAPFVIGGRIEVLAPAYEDVLDVGTKPIIRWRSENTEGPLRIELLGLGRRPVATIAASAVDDGEWHSWAVPDMADGIGYRVRVSERGNREISGMSALFQLGTRYEFDVPSIESDGTGGTTLVARPHYFAFGDKPTFRWRRIGADAGRLTLRLMRDGDTVKVITTRAADSGAFSGWTATNNLEVSSKYSLALHSTAKPTAMGRSVFFSVGGRVSVSVNSRKIKTGDTVTIRWATEGIDGFLTLDLVDQAGARVRRLGRGPVGTNQVSWPVATTARPRMARIRARSQAEPELEGFSEWFELNL